LSVKATVFETPALAGRSHVAEFLAVFACRPNGEATVRCWRPIHDDHEAFAVDAVNTRQSAHRRGGGRPNIVNAMPGDTADPVSLKTGSGSANRVMDVPKLEIVSPLQNFQKWPLARDRLRHDRPDVVADHDHPVDAEMIEEGHDVSREIVLARAIVGVVGGGIRAPESAVVRRDAPAPSGECGHDGTPVVPEARPAVGRTTDVPLPCAM